MAKTIHVQLRGRFVQNDLFSLKVLSIHNGIINLLDTNEGLVISLLQNKSNMTDLSLLVPDLFRGSIGTEISPGVEADLTLSVKTGVSLSVKTGFKPVSTEPVSTEPVSTEPVPTTNIWSGEIHPMEDNISSRIKEMNVLKKNLNAGDSFFSLLTGKIKTPYQRKAREILNRDILLSDQKITGLENLIGLGQGMTPSGDDFITGALFAEASSNIAVKIDKRTISEKLESTTYAGKTLIHLALQNSFPSYLLTFLKELSKSSEKSDLKSAALKVSEHGSTSGMDTLAGFYWYFEKIK